MHPNSSRTYLLVGLTALLLISLPLSMAERLRSWTVALVSPLWHRANIIAVIGIGKPIPQGNGLRQPLTFQEHLEAIELENTQLRGEVTRLTELLVAEQGIIDRVQAFASDSIEVDSVLARRRQERFKLLDLQLQSIPARVIFRSPTSWNSSFWLDVGEADNELLGRVVVAKNSPVVVGHSLVGVVDLVNRHQARVRLLTDPGFSPSVRAVRGDPQRQELLEHFDAVASGLAHDDGLFRSGDERTRVLELLLDIRERLQTHQATWLLAKGELQGSTLPLWRRKGSVVRGVGFNYDFADEEGPERDLITGRLLGCGQESREMPILKVDDLLVTTGLDGILIPGLHVARVTRVLPLGEGDYFYELEARPTVGDTDAISLVSVLPPLEQPE